MNTTTSVRDKRDLSFEPVENPQPRRLTRDQIDFYNQHGYVRPFRIFNSEEAQRNREYFDGLLKAMLAYDDGRDAYSICSYQTKCRGIYDIVTDARILDHVEDLLGPDFVCWGAHLFCKLAHDPKPCIGIRTLRIGLSINRAPSRCGSPSTMPTKKTPRCNLFRARTVWDT